jgi:hypothetical protein
MWLNCLSCEIELEDAPVLRDGGAFCCHGCAQGGPCVCTYDSYQRRVSSIGREKAVAIREILDAYSRSVGHYDESR